MLMKMKKKNSVDEILATFDLADVALIKSILDAENIDYYFKGESSLHVVKPHVEPVRLFVKKQDVEKVKKLLKNIKIKSWKQT